MSNSGYHCYAPDWIGFGFSDKPQAGYGFDYKGLWFLQFSWIMLIIFILLTNVVYFKYFCLSFLEDEFHSALEKLLETLNITSPFYLVIQVLTQNYLGSLVIYRKLVPRWYLILYHLQNIKIFW